MAIYPAAQVLAWSALVAWSVFVDPPPDPKFVGWPALWIGVLNASILTVPVASVSHVAGLAFGRDRWGPLSPVRLSRMHLAGGIAHPLLLQSLGAVLHAWIPGPDSPATVFQLVFVWAIAGPAAAAVALSRLTATRRDRAHAASRRAHR